MTYAIEARGLSFRYAGASASSLSGCSFRVVEGEVFGVLGPNGAGKTTLLRMLATLTLPEEGDLRLLGHDVPGGEARVRERLGVALGEYDRTFDHRLSTAENLRYYAAFYPSIRREMRARVDDALAKVGLADAARKPYGALSQGMKHRLALARALLPRPELLLLDEPTSGVDAEHSRNFLELVRELSEAGTTVVFTTHRLEEAGRLCDRVLILHGGRALAEEPPEALRRVAADVDVLELLLEPASDARLEGAIIALEDVKEARRLATGAVRVHYRVGSDAPFRVLDVARSSGRRLIDVRREAPSFEDAFHRLVEGVSA